MLIISRQVNLLRRSSILTKVETNLSVILGFFPSPVIQCLSFVEGNCLGPESQITSNILGCVQSLCKSINKGHDKSKFYCCNHSL